MPRSRPLDHDRFNRMYAAHLPSILGYAARRCAQPGDAADVAAEVFLIAWRRLGDVPRDQERLWLFGTAKRVLANHRRGARRRGDLAQRLRRELETGQIATPPDSDHLLVQQAVAALPGRDREILVLTVWDGLTPTEIATLEGVPAATVRSRLMRARNRLRVALDDGGSEQASQRRARSGHVPGANRP